VFDGSILENLTYALDEKVDEIKLKDIIIQAKCEFIYDLPNGLETQI
jgi:ABC-type multidrug transport system fused ATPase/permease subunit